MIHRNLLFSALLATLCTSNIFSMNGASALITAIRDRNLETTTRLLDQGVNPNAATTEHRPVIGLAERYNNFNASQLWLGPDNGIVIPEEPGEAGTTPLAYAVMSSESFFDGARRDIIDLLISRGARVNQREDNNFTPLMLAAIFNKQLAAQVLLENGADISIRARTPQHQTAAELARHFHHDALATLIEAHDTQPCHALTCDQTKTLALGTREAQEQQQRAGVLTRSAAYMNSVAHAAASSLGRLLSLAYRR